jgi:hypothetical protein
VRKLGGGVEIITPEALLRRYMDGNDEAEFRAVMKYRGMQLMVMDDVAIMKGQAEARAKLMEPILKLMKETREEQDAAAARARASVEEAARGAAGEALGRAMPYIDERLKDVEAAVNRRDTAAVENPMQRAMARTMETLVNQVMKSFGLGGEPQQLGVPGFTHETVKQGE